jgi:hypothetical protein
MSSVNLNFYSNGQPFLGCCRLAGTLICRGNMRLRRSSALSSRETRRRALATISSILIVASQIQLVPSREAVAIRRPSGDQATLSTSLAWTPTTMISAPASASHVRTVRSSDAVASRRPFGDHADPVG